SPHSAVRARPPQAPLPVDVLLQAPAADPPPRPGSAARSPRRPMTAHESYAAAMDLLQRAQVAYAARDFAGALVLVAEHARRFPRARLGEERESLRVRLLADAGYTAEARRAAAAF